MADNGEFPHPLVSNRKRKTATRPKKLAKTNAVGAAGLQGLFVASADVNRSSSQDSESTRYAIKDPSESMEIDSVLGDSTAQLQHVYGTTTQKLGSGGAESQGNSMGQRQHTQGAPMNQGDTTGQPQNTEGDTKHQGENPEPIAAEADDPEATRDYSNEARTYMAIHDLGRHYEYREGCLDLLTEPNLPLWTRVQTL